MVLRPLITTLLQVVPLVLSLCRHLLLRHHFLRPLMSLSSGHQCQGAAVNMADTVAVVTQARDDQWW